MLGIFYFWASVIPVLPNIALLKLSNYSKKRNISAELTTFF